MIPRLLGAAPGAMARGAALAVLVLVMGAALLGLSGWFITATGMAGLAGIGIAFDVFRPSAGVRFLALGRTAARYGERLLTHDAVLRALAALRVTVLRQQGRLDGRALTRLRGEAVLTRIVSDVDALDGLLLRVVLPVAAGLVTQAVAVAGLWWLTGPLVAVAVAGALLPASALVLWVLARATLAPSDRAEAEAQALRRGLIDAIRDRESLILAGRLAEREEALIRQDSATRAALCGLDRVERSAGAVLSVVAALAVAAGLVAGAVLLAQRAADPARAVIGLFVALALAETVLPLRRGFAEIGRMAGAARRLEAPVAAGTSAEGGGPGDPPEPPRDRSDPLFAGPPGAGGVGSRPRRPATRPVVAPARSGLRNAAPEAPSVRKGAALAGTSRGAAGPGRGAVWQTDYAASGAPLLRVNRPGLAFSLRGGGAVALTGPSGAGKSTLLLGIAGLLPVEGIALAGRAPCDWDDAALRRRVAMLPQRSALMAGTVREALTLAGDHGDDALWQALRAVRLDRVLAERGGLDARLGEGGSGLSGGQARRLALARCLMRGPDLLLLDEPTEGLDAETAAAVLVGLRDHLPRAALVVALHRGAENAIFEAVHEMRAPL